VFILLLLVLLFFVAWACLGRQFIRRYLQDLYRRFDVFEERMNHARKNAKEAQKLTEQKTPVFTDEGGIIWTDQKPVLNLEELEMRIYRLQDSRPSLN